MLTLICNPALPHMLVTQTQPQAPSSGAERAEHSHPSEPEEAQATNGTILITPLE